MLLAAWSRRLVSAGGVWDACRRLWVGRQFQGEHAEVSCPENAVRDLASKSRARRTQGVLRRSPIGHSAVHGLPDVRVGSKLA
jgi:hypothetical protein